jgi:glycosyltransferase involved in cell wall biosynthesis
MNYFLLPALCSEGIEMQDGIGILMRDIPQSFAEARIRLLSDYTLCLQIGMAARSAAIKKYDQKDVKQMIQEIIKGSVSNLSCDR